MQSSRVRGVQMDVWWLFPSLCLPCAPEPVVCFLWLAIEHGFSQLCDFGWHSWSRAQRLVYQVGNSPLSDPL